MNKLKNLAGEELIAEYERVKNDMLYFYNHYCKSGVQPPVSREHLDTLVNGVTMIQHKRNYGKGTIINSYRKQEGTWYADFNS